MAMHPTVAETLKHTQNHEFQPHGATKEQHLGRKNEEFEFMDRAL